MVRTELDNLYEAAFIPFREYFRVNVEVNDAVEGKQKHIYRLLISGVYSKLREHISLSTLNLV